MRSRTKRIKLPPDIGDDLHFPVGRLSYLIRLKLILLIVSSLQLAATGLQATEPVPWVTLMTLQKQADALVAFTLEEKAYEVIGKQPVIMNRIRIDQLFFDRTSLLAPAELVQVIAMGGLKKTNDGFLVEFRSLSTPRLEPGASYLAFLSREEESSAFRFTAGDLGVLRILEDRRVFTLEGYPVLGIKDGKLKVGPRPGGNVKDEEEGPPFELIDSTGKRSMVFSTTGSYVSPSAGNGSQAVLVEEFVRFLLKGTQ